MMPRHYATNYIKAGKDKDKQRQALKGCPTEWRELVKAHINILRNHPKLVK